MNSCPFCLSITHSTRQNKMCPYNMRLRICLNFFCLFKLSCIKLQNSVSSPKRLIEIGSPVSASKRPEYLDSPTAELRNNLGNIIIDGFGTTASNEKVWNLLKYRQINIVTLNFIQSDFVSSGCNLCGKSDHKTKRSKKCRFNVSNMILKFFLLIKILNN